jgi:hypothetical protein
LRQTGQTGGRQVRLGADKSDEGRKKVRLRAEKRSDWGQTGQTRDRKKVRPGQKKGQTGGIQV